MDDTRIGKTSLWEVNDWTSPSYTDSSPFQINHDTTSDGNRLIYQITKRQWNNMTSEEKNNVDYFAWYSGHSDKSDVLEGKIKLSLLQDKLSNIDLDGNKSYYTTLHWTMSCGNDYLNKTIQYTPANPVPEPATILLFGMGLLFAGFCRLYPLDRIVIPPKMALKSVPLV